MLWGFSFSAVGITLVNCVARSILEKAFSKFPSIFFFQNLHKTHNKKIVRIFQDDLFFSCKRNFSFFVEALGLFLPGCLENYPKATRDMFPFPRTLIWSTGPRCSANSRGATQVRDSALDSHMAEWCSYMGFNGVILRWIQVRQALELTSTNKSPSEWPGSLCVYMCVSFFPI